MELSTDFIKQNLMGPNALKIAEELTAGSNLKKGMRVLDLGCGKGLTSIFLAEKFGVTVFATDLWISPTENYERFKQVNCENLVYPIRADANKLPYADGFFDAVVTVDSYHYFGAEAGFLERGIVPLVKEGGLIMMAVPGLKREFDNGVPDDLQPYWQDDMNFYTAAWWHKLWEDSGTVEIIKSGYMSCHKDAWDSWLACDNEYAKNDVKMMRTDGSQYFDTVTVTARKK